ncbi:MAG: ATP-dependent sacrificial sulfur transferase LarE [Nitrososphaerota archaeon]
MNVPGTEERLRQLVQWFSPFKGALVAYSGGVDSTLVAYAAKLALGERAVAVTQASALVARRELEVAKSVARRLGLKHIVIGDEDELPPLISANTPLRCYYCRRGLAERLLELAKQLGADVVVDGTEIDDLRDFRPGLRALRERGIRSPLLELGFNKQEVRRLAKALGLPNHAKPAESCLATRIPHWTGLTLEALRTVEKAEELVAHITGASLVRVRVHGDVARVEVGANERRLFFDQRVLDKVAEALQALGFRHVALDMQGYRRGSVNASRFAEKQRLSGN